MFTGLFKKKNEEITVESLKKKKPKYEDLQGVLYFHGGGMEGSDHRVELKKEDDGTLFLTFCDSSDPGQAWFMRPILPYWNSSMPMSGNTICRSGMNFQRVSIKYWMPRLRIFIYILMIRIRDICVR